MTILDASVLIDYLVGRDTPMTEWIERNVDVYPLGITDLNVYEVLQGIREEKRVAEVQAQLGVFQLWPAMQPGTEGKAAEFYRHLRRRGITVRKSIDCLVATFCIQGGHALLHNDRDFEGFERYLGLEVVHPDRS